MIIDERITSSCFELAQWPLSRVFLKNNADFPWLILVPCVDEAVQDIDQLSPSMRYTLMDEITQLSGIVRRYFQPEKLNVAALGNIVSQLHVHVVGRFSADKLWPHAIWQADQPSTAYSEQQLNKMLFELRALTQ